MIKADIIKDIASDTGIEKATVSQVVELFMESVKEANIKGEPVLPPWFRQFYNQRPGGKNCPQHIEEHGHRCPGLQNTFVQTL